MPFIDQRQMSGPTVHGDADSVRGFWEQHAEARRQQGREPFPMAPQRTRLHRSKTRLRAYVSANRWVADCAGGPTGQCRGGIACWPDHEDGCCLDCGTVYPIDFPHQDEVEHADRVLAVRPTEHRNWRPHEGETVDDLRAENITHGYHPDGDETTLTALANQHGMSPSVLEQMLRSPEARKIQRELRKQDKP